MSKETRAVKGIEVREAPEGSEFIGVLDGYAAVFDSDSVEFQSRKGPFVERIQRGAFSRSLREREDVKALWSHRSDAIIARSPQTLKLSEDDRGLRAEIMLADTSLNRDLMANVRAGNVDAMSFGFEVKGQSWDTGSQERAIRTLTDVELHEISAVVWPAYPDTTLAARSLEEALQATEEEEVREGEPETDGEQSTSNAPRRALWAARLGVTTKPAQNTEE